MTDTKTPRTRQQLDRRLLDEGRDPDVGLPLYCRQHPVSPVQAVYRQGVVRVLCVYCGFETEAIKVATDDG